MKRIFIYSILILILAGCATSSVSPNTQAANYNVELGLGYLQEGDLIRAKHKLLLAEQQAPNNPAVHDAMAYFFERVGETSKAECYYQKAVQLMPRSGATQNNYGTFLCRQKRYQQALLHFQLAIADPSYLYSAQVYENAGLCALRIPDHQAAIAFFKRALQQNPNNRRVLFEMAKLGYNQR